MLPRIASRCSAARTSPSLMTSVRLVSSEEEKTRRVITDIEHLIRKPEPPREMSGPAGEAAEPDIIEDQYGNKQSPYGYGRRIITKLQEPMAIEPQEMRYKFRVGKYRLLRIDQTYQSHLLEKLGPDLLAANFLVMKDAKVKFVQEDFWFSMTENYTILKAYQSCDNPEVEAIDASGCSLVFEAMDYLRGLKSLRYLNLSRCPRVDDHCLAKIAVHCQTLEYLDVSECPGISERGLATLHSLRNLKRLVVHNLPGVMQKQLICLLLEESIPGLFIDGIEYNKDKIDEEIEEDLKKYEKRYQLNESVDVDDSYLNVVPRYRFLQKVFFKYLPKSSEKGILAKFIGTPGVADRYSQIRDGI